jgi:hypothetical protein
MPDEEEFSVGVDLTIVQIRCMNGEGATDEMYGRTFEVPMRRGRFGVHGRCHGQGG